VSQAVLDLSRPLSGIVKVIVCIKRDESGRKKPTEGREREKVFRVFFVRIR